MALAPRETGLHLRPHDSIGSVNGRKAASRLVETARRATLYLRDHGYDVVAIGTYGTVKAMSPRELREVVLLTTVQEMSSADVAEILGIPEGSVRQRMFRARQILREKMLQALEKKS